ncbi:hypothetical protein EXIGLDRAFT_673499, partial [Exidia glandulosa HHB12029]
MHITYCIIDAQHYQVVAVDRLLCKDDVSTLLQLTQTASERHLGFPGFTVQGVYWLHNSQHIRSALAATPAALNTARDWQSILEKHSFRVRDDETFSDLYAHTEAADHTIAFVVFAEVLRKPLRLTGYEAFIKSLQNKMRDSPAPSTASQNSELAASQTVTAVAAILNGRPRPLRGPPLGVYHPVFPRFVARYTDRTPVIFESNDIRSARELIAASAKFFRDEAAFQQAIAKPLEHFLGPYSASKYSTYYLPKHSFECDCHRRTPETDGALSLIGELKNGIGEGESDPFEQAAAVCCRMAIHVDESVRQMRLRTCMPCFLLAMTGTHLAVGGAVLADRYIVGRFTDYISLIPLDHGDDPELERIEIIVRTLRSLRICLDELDKWYEMQWVSPPRLPEVFPMPHRVEVAGIKITYIRRMKTEDRSCAIFRASIEMNGEQLAAVVKFARRYCVNAHSAMARASLAPKLYHAQQDLDVGAFCVIMEFVEEQPALPPDAKLKVENAVERLHAFNFVHGDLRQPNILFRGDVPLIIDYDWAGLEGEAKYPMDLSNQILWPPGVERAGAITKAHDLFWAKQFPSPPDE